MIKVKSFKSAEPIHKIMIGLMCIRWNVLRVKEVKDYYDTKRRFT